ncbi:MAG: beta-1,6-N-acetylglucosaminyltransferase [Eubacterium sp.]
MHAYLILAHNEFELLENLIKALDDSRNDIFIHIDKKVKAFDFDKFKNTAKHSSIAFSPRISIKWGDMSMVSAEYLVLHTALDSGKKYDFVHLISGVDIPLMTQEDMHAFFGKNNGLEFIHFGGEELRPVEFQRVAYYHFATGRRNYFNRFITKAESVLGRLLGINRVKNLTVGRGSQWFSITGDFAQYLLSQEDFVKRQFKHTFIPDEFFVQTVFLSSPFKSNLFHKEFDDSSLGCMRYTDWHRGSPYTFTSNDYDEIINCGCLFARKFSNKADSQITQMLYKRIGVE